MSYLDNFNSERLFYRPLNAFYVEPWAEYLSNPLNTEFYPILDLTPLERSKSWIQSQLGRYNDQTYGMYAVHLSENEEFIGQCGALIQEVNGKEEVEIGYHFFQEYTGKGYATEAAQHFKKWVFENNPTQSIISIIKEGNSRSQKVALRNEMREEQNITWKEMKVKIFRVYR